MLFTPGATRKSDVIANRPLASSVPNGFRFYATDQDGGQEYEQVAGVWQPRGPSVNGTGAVLLDHVDLASSYTTANNTTADVAIPGLSVDLTLGSRPVKVRSKIGCLLNLNALATGTLIRVQTRLWGTIGGGANTLYDQWSATFKPLTGEAWYFNPVVEYEVASPVAGQALSMRTTVNVSVSGASVTVYGRSISVSSYIEAVQQ